MYEWERAARHFWQYNRIATEYGFTNKQGKLVRLNSRLFWPEFHVHGHTSIDFTRCVCREK
jgi:hypothetical protein